MYRRDYSNSGFNISTDNEPNNGKTSNTGVKFSPSVAGNESELSFNNPEFGSHPANTPAMAERYREFDKSDTSPIIPEIRISNYSFRVREVILAVVSIIALVACLVLVALVATNRSKDKYNVKDETLRLHAASNAAQTLCTDPPCLKSAAYAVSLMNRSVNPCDNFHAYACGNFPTLNPLNPDIAQRTIFWNLYYENEDKLRTLLEKSSKRTPSHTAEHKLIDFFMSCVDDYGKMAAGGKPFIEKVVVPMGGWDVIDTFDARSFSLQENVQRTSVDFWTAAMFTFRVTTDKYDSRSRVIEIGMSGMGMSWAYYVRENTQQVRTDYKKFMRTVAKHLARDSGLTLDPSQLDNKIETFVEDAYDIEFQLANITAHTLPTMDPHNHENRITLTALTTSTNNVIDFVAFFQYMFGANHVNANTQIILSEESWIRRMLAMVGALPADVKARKLQNYMIWRLAQSYATEMSWDYIHASRDFFVDQYGVALFLGTSKHCFSLADKKFPDALGSLFARNHFLDTNKYKAEEIVGYVKRALLDSIESNKIMDATTKQRAKAKLQASTDKMGYPEIYMQDARIDQIYQSLSINRSDYFQNLLQLNAFEKTDWTRRLIQGEDRSIWLYNSYDTAMTFYNSWNQLLVPAGILQFPVYEWTLPHYYNFGAMGSLVGHYLVHAVDNWGGYYGPTGNRAPWYTNATKVNYRNVRQCFAGVYNNKTMGPFAVNGGQRPPITIPVNGNRFAWEGLAETSGIRNAYKAYKKWVADNGPEKPTPTPHYTNDQSFFLAYAQTTCYTRTDALGRYYAQIQRVTENIRTNTALSLLDEFTSAFNCPAGSPMNSKTKCDTL